MVGNILAVGLMSLGMGMSGVKDEPQKVVQTQEALEINTTNISKANAIAFFSHYMDLTEAPNGQEYTFQENEIVGTLTYGGNNITSAKWSIAHVNPHTGSQNQISLNAKYTLTNNETAAQTLYYEIDNDSYGVYSTNTELTTYPEEVGSLLLTGEIPPTPMGDSIIGSIASGLGLIGALATEFLAGFGALFYVQGALTPFAIFSLVMLGVAVSFAIVKLVLNLIRSNTGA